MLDLRPYQIEALEGIEQAEKEGVRRPLVVHPTGTGKGVEMGATAAQRADRGRTLVMVHRDELARQFIEKLGWAAPELRPGIVKADQNDVDADVVVASVQTGSRDNRLEQIVASARRSPFGTVLVDEAHHAPAPTWTKMLTALGAFSQYGPLAVGFTATPERDGKTLGVWERVVSYMSIREAIYGGWLCPILPAEVVETNIDLDRVRKNGGDYSDGSLGEALEASGAIAQIADAYVQHAAERKGVAFTPTVRTAHQLAQALRDRGVPAEALDGTTDTEIRREMLRRLKSGKTQVVVNCGVLTEGFDEPSISCVVIARPTKFHGLYVQMVGRGTRKHPTKENLLVIDVTGVSKRHELVGLVDLGLEIDDKRKKKDPDAVVVPKVCPVCEEQCQLPEHRCALCHRYLPMRLLSEGASRHENCDAGKAGKVDIFGTSRLRWLQLPDGAYCLGAGKEVVIMVPAGLDTWRVATYENTRLKVLQDAVPADWAMGIGEDRAKAFTRLVERDARWLRQRPTDAQLRRLVLEGFPEAKLGRIATRGDAADLVTRIQGRRGVRRLLAPSRG